MSERKTDAEIGSHKSIIAYLSANNLPKSAAALREEVGLGEDVYDVATEKKYETLLEKKWTSIVRLQKKVCDGFGYCRNMLSIFNPPREWANREQSSTR